MDEFWDKDKNKLTLGDFNKLVDFLLRSSGKYEIVEEEIKNNEE